MVWASKPHDLEFLVLPLRDFASDLDEDFSSTRFPQYPCLLDHKTLWDRSMQVDGHFPNFGKVDLPSSNWVSFELRKQQGLDLSKLFEAWKSKPSFLEILPSVMQTPNGCLQNLRRGNTEFWELFLRLGKCVLLDVIGRKGFVGWNDVLSFQRTIIQTTFTRIDPIFDFSQGIVIDLARYLQPMKHYLFLASIGINSVAVVHDQSHASNSNTELLVALLQSISVGVKYTNLDSLTR